MLQPECACKNTKNASTCHIMCRIVVTTLRQNKHIPCRPPILINVVSELYLVFSCQQAVSPFGRPFFLFPLRFWRVDHGRGQRCSRPCATLPTGVINVTRGRDQRTMCLAGTRMPVLCTVLPYRGTSTRHPVAGGLFISC